MMREAAQPVEGAGDRPCDIDRKRFAADPIHLLLTIKHLFSIVVVFQ